METNTITTEEVIIRATLTVSNYVGNSQLLDVVRHIDDTITIIDGLYTQLALITVGDIQEANEYEEKARSFLKEYYYAAIRSISYEQTGEGWAISTFHGYPFSSLFNPLLEFNRRLLGKHLISVGALTLSAISMGSINIDLLGVGKILDFIEHIVKQIRWEAHHEKEIAARSRKISLLEEQLLGQRIIEAHLANEEKKLHVANKKIELFNTIQKLDLPLQQKQKLIQSILDKIDLIEIMADVQIIRKKR